MLMGLELDTPTVKLVGTVRGGRYHFGVKSFVFVNVNAFCAFATPLIF